MFKLGDRVATPQYGTGKIVIIDHGDIGVEHDKETRHLHDLGGHTKPGFGWWYGGHKLTKLATFKGNIK